MVFGIPGTENWGSSFSNMGSTFMTFMYWTVVFIIALCLIGGLIWYFSSKKKYNQAVKLIYISEDNRKVKKEVKGLKGGVVSNKNGIKDYAIKLPYKFKTLKLGYMPDRNLVNRNGELVFSVIGDGTILQQVEESEVIDHKQKLSEEQIKNIIGHYVNLVNTDDKYLNLPEEEKIRLVDDAVNRTIEENIQKAKTNIIKPIPNNVKTTTINNIHDVRNILDKNRLTTQAMIMGALIIMIIGHLVWTYIVIKQTKG